jgi:hypothetical protein
MSSPGEQRLLIVQTCLLLRKCRGGAKNSLPHSNVRDNDSRNCVMNLVGKTEKTCTSLDNLKCDFGGKRAVNEETEKRVEIKVQVNAMES